MIKFNSHLFLLITIGALCGCKVNPIPPLDTVPPEFTLFFRGVGINDRNNYQRNSPNLYRSNTHAVFGRRLPRQPRKKVLNPTYIQ